MLIENATQPESQVQLVPYPGIVNPEHMNQTNCVPVVTDTHGADQQLEALFIEDFLRKATEFQQMEQIESLPIEIRLGTVYIYQNRRQQSEYPRSLAYRHLRADFLRNEERRARLDKHFLITFNKNKGINDVSLFEHELTCAGFRQNPDQQPTYRLYLRHQTKRLILELARKNDDQRFFSVKRLLKYATKYTHIDVVRSKEQSKYPETFEDIFDVRTSLGKALDEEELHINDEYCDFLQIKDLDQCVFETRSTQGQTIYQFNRRLLPYFDFFQIKQTDAYEYSCIDSRFFGVRILVEEQTGYDLHSSSKTTIPCLQTKNVIMARLLGNDVSEEEAHRIWTIGIWLSELATRCINPNLPTNQIYSRCPGALTSSRRAVRWTFALSLRVFVWRLFLFSSTHYELFARAQINEDDKSWSKWKETQKEVLVVYWFETYTDDHTCLWTREPSPPSHQQRWNKSSQSADHNVQWNKNFSSHSLEHMQISTGISREKSSFDERVIG